MAIFNTIGTRWGVGRRGKLPSNFLVCRRWKKRVINWSWSGEIIKFILERRNITVTKGKSVSEKGFSTFNWSWVVGTVWWKYFPGRFLLECVSLRRGLITVVDGERQDDGRKVGCSVEEVYDCGKLANLQLFLRQVSEFQRQIDHN